MIEIGNRYSKALMIQRKINEILIDIFGSFKKKTNVKKNYVEYISSLLYIKYINNLKSDINVSFENIYKERKNYYVANIIDDELEKLRKELKNDDLFSNIKFKDIVIYREIGEENILGNIIEWIYSLEKYMEDYSRSSTNIISKAYEYVLENNVIKEDTITEQKEFYTPFYITDIMSYMIKERDTESVFDPSCGSGNFLISANQGRKLKTIGVERNLTTYNICMTNLLLHGIVDSDIIYQNEKRMYNIKYDIAISNPPFSQKDWIEKMPEDNLFYIKENGVPQSAVADYVYVLNMFRNLNENGKMAVILPHGVLFRENETEVRKKLIKNNCIDAIIGLPENLFYFTRVSVIILILSKNKKDDKVLFIDASKEYLNERRNNSLPLEVQKMLINTYKNRKEIEHYSYLASKQEIEKNNFNLTIKRYVKEKVVVRPKAKKQDILEELKNLEKEQNILEENINDVLETLGIQEIFEKNEKEKQEEIYTIDYGKIGKNIKQIRRERQYTMEQLAEKLNISVAFLSRIENATSHIRLERLGEICKILNVSLLDILK